MNQKPILAIFLFTALAVLIGAVILLGGNLYGRYLRISRGKAALLLIATIFAAIGFGVWRANELNNLHSMEPVRLFGDRDLDETLWVILAVLLPFVAVPFLAKLYLTWIAGQVTDAEKSPGREGIRAWLRGGNLLCAVLISLSLWLGFGYSFWMALTLTLMAILAYPVWNMTMETTAPQAAAPAGDTLSPDRERVLKMLDDGKITAPESAELLNALAHSAPARAPQSAPAPHRKMVWLGAALVVIAFFLPWFAINPQQTMNDAIRRMPFSQFGIAAPQFEGMTVYVAGGDLAHGLGWCVLLLGVAAAALPFVAANLDSQTCQKVSLIALGIGAIILLYLLTENIRFVSIGILLALAGYALEFIGVLKARKLDWGRAMQ